MSMRRVLLSVSVSACALALVPAPAPAAGERPNIIVIMTDDQTVESMRVMPIVKAQLADQGATFTRSFASFPLCCPSRATFLTGQYAHNHGVRSNVPPAGGFQKLDSSNTLPVWLQRAGYHTGHVGKYLNGYGSQPKLVPAGWSEWYGSVDPSTYWFYNYTLNENGRLVHYGSDPGSYQTDVYAAKAGDFVRRRAPFGPYFLSLAVLAPHAGRPIEPGDPPNLATPVPAPRHRNRFASEPLPRPPSFNEPDVSDKPFGIRTTPLLRPARIGGITENYRQRLESLLAVDDAVGALVQAVRETGELGNTLIIFTSDNGFFHGEHRAADGKLRVYEPSIRVPLIIRGPGVRPGIQIGNLVANIDTAPTIVDAANASAGRAMDGRSLFPIIRDSRLEWGRDILLETTGHNSQNTYAAIRTRRFLYANYTRGEHELYDLEDDPDEVTNLQGDAAHSTVRSLIGGRLSSLRGCSAKNCRTRPRVSLRLRYRRGRTRGRLCARGSVRGRVRGDERQYVERTSFFVNNKRVVRDRRAPFSRKLSRRRFRRGRRAKVRALVEMIDGRSVSLDRRVRACR
jgi:N-acetylglucosamine-6-sulfatase